MVEQLSIKQAGWLSDMPQQFAGFSRTTVMLTTALHLCCLQVHGGPAGSAAGLSQREGGQQAGGHGSWVLLCCGLTFSCGEVCLRAPGLQMGVQCASLCFDTRTDAAMSIVLSNACVMLLQALLTAYMPYLTIDCTAELVLFRPNIGNVLGEQQARQQLAVGHVCIVC
jgi:hypothetical protein